MDEVTLRSGMVTVPRKIGAVLSTTLPRPVDDVTPVPPRATGKIPKLKLSMPSPVRPAPLPTNALATTLPRSVTLLSVGPSEKTTFPIPVLEVVPVPPLDTPKIPVVLARLRFVNPAPFPRKALAVIALATPSEPTTFPRIVMPERIGAVLSTTLPVPVDDVTPVPPCATSTITLPILPMTLAGVRST